MESKRILVVDDHPPTVRLIRNALEQEGFSVASAANGAECLLALHRELPDLVVLDVVMPVLDGFQTLRILREDAQTKHLPVIILSIRDSDKDVLEGWQTGVDLYLTKPFQMDELVAAVKRLVSAIEDS
jgi:DNA-binding response OmpR family regulator